MTERGGETGSSMRCDSSGRRRPRVRFWQIPLLLLLAGVIGVLLLRWHWRREFRARVEAARVAGYPVTLAELVPRYCDGIPQDPFDGEPLRYRHLERGYVVYSIGPDETDDGGKEPPLRKGSDKGTRPPYDITFIVER